MRGRSHRDGLAWGQGRGAEPSGAKGRRSRWSQECPPAPHTYLCALRAPVHRGAHETLNVSLAQADSVSLQADQLRELLGLQRWGRRALGPSGRDVTHWGSRGRHCSEPAGWETHLGPAPPRPVFIGAARCARPRPFLPPVRAPATGSVLLTCVPLGPAPASQSHNGTPAPTCSGQRPSPFLLRVPAGLRPVPPGT